MEIQKLNIPGALHLKHVTHSDHRGVFFELFNQQRFKSDRVPVNWVQDNVSTSQQYVLRGLHMQAPPYAQAKLVTCLKGHIFDVIVDYRENSDTFLKWEGVGLQHDEPSSLYVPEGCLHGFFVLSKTALVHYKCSEFYVPDSEFGIRWDDPDIGIVWPIPENVEPIISGKDKDLPLRVALG